MNIENSFVFHIFTVIKLRHYNCLNKITYTLVDNLYINKTCQTCCETFQALCQRKREEYIENNLLDTCSIKEIFISWRSIFFYFLFFVFFCLFAVFFFVLVLSPMFVYNCQFYSIMIVSREWQNYFFFKKLFHDIWFAAVY